MLCVLIMTTSGVSLISYNQLVISASEQAVNWHEGPMATATVFIHDYRKQHHSFDIFSNHIKSGFIVTNIYTHGAMWWNLIFCTEPITGEQWAATMGALGTAPAMTEEISSYIQGMKIRTFCEATGYMFVYFFTYNLTEEDKSLYCCCLLNKS